jgi:tetratricopeptide (TPR) repeat protein
MPLHSRTLVGLSLAVLLGGSGPPAVQGRSQVTPLPQSDTHSKNRVTSQQSITVEANLTPEEKEEGNINEVYQTVYSIQRRHDCQVAIEKYLSVVIPAAERAKFSIPKNKFLYLAYRGIADCDMDLKKYGEAEETYQKLFGYLPVWPGIDDSDYPINFRSLGLSRMAQEKWADAEAPLQKSISIFDEQIDRASKSDADFERNEMANDYRMAQNTAMYLLAVDYFREKRNAESLQLLDRAYVQATQFHGPSATIKKIVDSGIAISIESGDLSSGVTWSKRALSTN